ncbi:MAG: phosphoenolpyruvate mutase [Deltaproteobacteria bacterium]|nr:phosphoenolpyruvate mutase [Deltaproteobacteria bacterium]
MKKTTQLRQLLFSESLEFLCEAHNGLSAKIVEEAGFKGIWGSGLSLSAAMAVRDNNEASWTQILETVEFMSDATSIPVLLDGDTGYGNFNNVRRLVQKLEQRGIGGVCIEDKLFPKTNSFLRGEKQPLATLEEFTGKIKAAKDSQRDSDFCLVARTEAFIAGWGLFEALRRADAYHRAGADAILIHSKLSKPDEVLAFKKEWGRRSPVVIVPTTYYATPMEVFQEAGFSTVIWANMILRSAITAMKAVASQLKRENSLLSVEDKIVPVKEVFRLQGDQELEEAERLYLPSVASETKAVILAASRGEVLDALTQERPKAMIPVGGEPLLFRQIRTLQEAGVKDVTVVRGYCKEVIDAPGLRYVDNEIYASSKELVSLWKGIQNLSGPAFIAYGDILYKKYVPTLLLQEEEDFVIAVDSEWERSGNRKRYADYVSCDVPYRRTLLDHPVYLTRMDADLVPATICGEWIGLLRASAEGIKIIQKILAELSQQEAFSKMRMAHLFNALRQKGYKARVHYIRGHWLDVDDLTDLVTAHAF